MTELERHDASKGATICLHPECDRPAVRRTDPKYRSNLCETHYQLWLSRNTLPPAKDPEPRPSRPSLWVAV